MPRPDIEITRRKKRFGRCRICQKVGKLTKEHVPPEKAFNNQSYLKHYADETEKAGRIKWRSREERTNGVYVFTLCKKCNSQTGYRYGSDYVNFVESFISDAIPENANKTLKIEVKDFFPLRVIKQAISIILSTSEPTSFLNHKPISSRKINPSLIRDIEINNPEKSHLRNVYQELRNFVRKRDSTGLPPNVRLYAFAIVNAGTGYRTGIFGKVKLSSKKVSFVVVTGSHPILWVLVLDGDIDEKLLDVTDWANFEYKQRKTLKVEMPCYWSVGKHPLDFRNPIELYEQVFVNRMIREGLVFSGDLDKAQELQEAIYFARVLGKTTKEGYLISKFESCIFYEFGEINGWLENATIEQTKQVIEWRLKQQK